MGILAPDMSRTGLQNLTLVLGGARSGKSAFAEDLVADAGARPVYIATAEARDGEMHSRIAAHRARRGSAWDLRELPRATGADMRGLTDPALFDCLTLWLSNTMEAGDDWHAHAADLIAGFRASPAPVVAVSNEIGLGLVPDTALGRAFRDAQGTLNQMVAAEADTVIFVAAGLPLYLKGAGVSGRGS